MSGTKLSYNLKLAVVFFAIQAILDLFFATFFISFVMHLSSNQILSVSSYKLFEFFATCAGFFLIANWCKRKNIKYVFALKQIPQVLLLLSIMFLQERVVEYVVPLGLLYGAGRALYFLPMNTIVGINTTGDNLARFTGVKNAWIYAIRIIAPIVLGFLIDTNSYTQMAYAMLAITLLECVFIAMLRSNVSQDKLRIDYRGFVDCIKNQPIMRRFFFMKVLRGFSIGMLATIITMYTVYIFQTNLNLGILTTIFAICSVLVSWFFSRWIHCRYHTLCMWVSMILLLVAVLLIVYNTTPLTFLLYSFIYSTAVVLIECIGYFTVYSVSHSDCICGKYETEFFVLRDFALFLGRWLCLICLMYIGFFGGYESLRWFLLLVTLGIVAYGVLQINISCYLRNQKI